VIEPGIDVANATDEEIIAAYMRDGMSRADAEVYLAAIRASDEFPLG